MKPYKPRYHTSPRTRLGYWLRNTTLAALTAAILGGWVALVILDPHEPDPAQRELQRNIDACITTDPDHTETKDQLEARYHALHVN